MSYVGRHDKRDQLRRIAVALARTAWRNGDAFGFHAANETPQDALALPARVHRGAAEWVERRLARFEPAGSSARGLLRVIPQLPSRRALVFVVSDFFWPEDDIRDILRGLAHHSIVPVVLRDPAESDAVHRHGIAVLCDLETGEQRFVWLRPRLIDALRARKKKSEEMLTRVCRSAGCVPFIVHGRFDPAALTRHFLETAA
jgi:uncharacterized protein (DUF58 family)